MSSSLSGAQQEQEQQKTVPSSVPAPINTRSSTSIIATRIALQTATRSNNTLLIFVIIIILIISGGFYIIKNYNNNNLMTTSSPLQKT